MTKEEYDLGPAVQPRDDKGGIFVKNNPLFLFFENFVVDFFENKKSCQIEKIIFGGDFLLV